MAAKIVLNGKEYDSVEAMPAEERATYEKAMSLLGDKAAGILTDADHNGVPDILEKLGATTKINFTTSTIVYQGQTYNSADELPPEAKEKYQQAMAKLNSDRNGIPDVLEGMAGASGNSPIVSVKTATTTTQPVRTATTPASTNTWLWWLVVAFLVALVAGLVVLLILK